MQYTYSFDSVTVMRLTLKGYQSFASAQASATEREESLDDLSILRAFLSYSNKEVDDLPIKVTKSVLESIYELLNKTEYKFTPTFKHKGILYGFIPNLDNITYGENTDLVKYISNWDTMHRAMAVAYRPIKKNWLGRPKLFNGKYVIEDYKGTSNADAFLDLDVEIVLGMQVFFYNLTKELVNSIPSYLQSLEIPQEMLTSLQANGESMQSFINYHKEI